MALHTLNRPPSDERCLQDCLKAVTSGDQLLLIEDGVYHALPAYIEPIVARGLPVYILAEDAQARGVYERISDQANLVDSQGFVELCCQQDKVVSWF